MRVLRASSQNRSNKQSIQEELHKIQLFSSSVLEKNWAKISMVISTLFCNFWTQKIELDMSRLWGGDPSPETVLEEGVILSGLLVSWARIEATLRTRGRALSVLNEEIDFSGESCSTWRRLFARTQTISGLKTDCSRASSNTEHSSCQK